jgi:8-oxo-dGTP diphosphatase
MPFKASPPGRGRGLRVATLVVATSGRRLLLLRRRKQPNLGLWSPPGGMVEPGEDPLACAVREFREETGLELRTPELAAIVSELDSVTLEAWLTFVYRGTARGRPQADSREGSAVWIRERDVSRLPRPAADPAILAAAAGTELAVLRVTLQDGALVDVSALAAPYGNRTSQRLASSTER